MTVRQYFTLRRARQADRARRKTEARFGWLVRNSSDFIMAVDAEGTLDYVSPSVERLLGKRRAPSCSARRSPDLAHPEDAAELVDPARRGPSRRPAASFTGEWRIRQADGQLAARRDRGQQRQRRLRDVAASCSTPATSRSARRSSRS